MQLRKAARQKAKIRLGLSAASGGGKTVSALLIAYGITGDWDKIALVDTENGSADLYANHTLNNGVKIGEFQVLPLLPPYAPERYVEAIRTCESAGVEVIILDSITHEWDGDGGILRIADTLTGDSFTKWKILTPRHQAFIDSILKSPCHVITTVRRKQEYAMLKDETTGKNRVEKLGLREVTREGFDYELTVNLELDQNHNAWVGKDRTGLFAGNPAFVPSEETGRLIAEWCESGQDVDQQVQEAIGKLQLCNTTDEVVLLGENLPLLVSGNADFKAAGNARFALLRDQAKLAQQQGAAEQPGETATQSEEPAPAAESNDQSVDQPAGPVQVAESAARQSDPEQLLVQFKEAIATVTEVDELNSILDLVNVLSDEPRKHLRRTINARTKQMGWIANPDTKRIEAPAAQTGGETNPAGSETKQPEGDTAAPAAETKADAKTVEVMLDIIAKAETSDHLASIARTNQAVLESNPELEAAFRSKNEEVKVKEQAKQLAGADPKNLIGPATVQTFEWFKARVGKLVWMQGKTDDQFTGAYDIEGDEYPDYMVNTLQAKEGFTFRDLTPEEAKAAAEQAAEATA